MFLNHESFWISYWQNKHCGGENLSRNQNFYERNYSVNGLKLIGRLIYDEKHNIYKLEQKMNHLMYKSLHVLEAVSSCSQTLWGNCDGISMFMPKCSCLNSIWELTASFWCQDWGGVHAVIGRLCGGEKVGRYSNCQTAFHPAFHCGSPTLSPRKKHFFWVPLCWGWMSTYEYKMPQNNSRTIKRNSIYIILNILPITMGNIILLFQVKRQHFLIITQVSTTRGWWYCGTGSVQRPGPHLSSQLWLV